MGRARRERSRPAWAAPLFFSLFQGFPDSVHDDLGGVGRVSGKFQVVKRLGLADLLRDVLHGRLS